MMTSVELGTLFDDSRFPRGLSLIPLIIYFPLGILLAIVRCFIGLQAFLASCLLPKFSWIRSLILRIMCGTLGIFVSQNGTKNKDEKVKVYCANYTSPLDHVAIDLIMPNLMPCVWDLPPALIWLLGYTDMGAKEGRDKLIQNVKKHCTNSQLPVLTFPEGASTNGKVGLLKFSVWPFSLDQPVQPILVQLSRPSLLNIAPSILGSRWWLDGFWFLFVPYTCFHISILPVLEKSDEENVDQFTSRVQKTMASTLNLKATSHTSADKVEYAKRKLFIPPSSASKNSTTPNTFDDDENSHLNVMARQVKEVISQVPMYVIKKDLTLTKDVDLTITNILEGKVEYVPEGENNDTQNCNKQGDQKSLDITGSQKPKAFAKSSKERELSLSERKQIMIEKAKVQYMEKHGMI